MKYILTPTREIGVETDLLVRTQSGKIKAMLDKAVEFMRNTKDPSHGVDHLNHVLKDANRFFNSMGDRFDINKEVLLLAIYWHDVWKSQHTPTAWNYLFNQLYEGWGSMFMFKRYAKCVGLSTGMTRSVSYAIRKHSAMQFHPAKTPEAQLLWDIDTLDLWNSQRTKALFKNSRWTNTSILDSYLLYMKTIGFPLNFEWTKNELKKIKPLFFQEMYKFRESLVKGNKNDPPLFICPKGVSGKWNLDNKS